MSFGEVGAQRRQAWGRSSIFLIYSSYGREVGGGETGSGSEGVGRPGAVHDIIGIPVKFFEDPCYSDPVATGFMRFFAPWSYGRLINLLLTAY